MKYNIYSLEMWVLRNIRSTLLIFRIGIVSVVKQLLLKLQLTAWRQVFKILGGAEVCYKFTSQNFRSAQHFLSNNLTSFAIFLIDILVENYFGSKSHNCNESQRCILNCSFIF
jgi:uncharacterized membrane protein AbrB (regulator of aidB expression)